MSDGKALVFGDVVRVDPAKNPKVPQPDDRRWMIVSFDDRMKWTMLYIGPFDDGELSHWPTLYGFVEVES